VLRDAGARRLRCLLSERLRAPLATRVITRLSTSVASHPLGPNGRFVDLFLDRVSAMTPADVDAAVVSWRESQHAPRDWAAAEEAAATALVRTERGEAAWTLQDRIHAVVCGPQWARQRAASLGALRSAVTAEYLVASAALALLVADVLPPRHLARLYAPFLASVPLAEISAVSAPTSLAANDA